MHIQYIYKLWYYVSKLVSIAINLLKTQILSTVVFNDKNIITVINYKLFQCMVMISANKTIDNMQFDVRI